MKKLIIRETQYINSIDLNSRSFNLCVRSKLYKVTADTVFKHEVLGGWGSWQFKPRDKWLNINGQIARQIHKYLKHTGEGQYQDYFKIDFEIITAQSRSYL